MSAFARLRRLLSKRRNETELQSELAFHLEEEIRQNIRAGMSPDEARRQALIAFGGVQQTTEAVRRVHWTDRLGTFLQDARFGLRLLRRAPGFAFVAVITLALGIGANTAVFSSADALLLRPLTFPQLDRLVTVFVQHGSGGIARQMSPADFYDYQQQSRSFQELAAYSGADFNITGGDASERVSGAQVSANFFTAIKVQPIIGRTFFPEEEQPGKASVAVIGYGVWTRRFGNDPKVIGQNIELNGKPYTVIGVLDKKIMFPGGAELWAPLERTDKTAADHKSFSLEVLGRLKPGAALKEAQQEMGAEAQRLASEYPATNRDLGVRLRPLRLVVNGTLMLPFAETLFMAALLVLFLACANVSILQLSRNAARSREMAVRTALGARRERLVRQLLVESLVLASMGTAAAFVLAKWVIAVQVASTSPTVARIVAGLSDMRVDKRAFLFMLAVAVFTVFASGLLPALEISRPDVNAQLKEGGQSSSGCSRHWIRSTLIVAQIAMALALLAGTIVSVSGFQRMAASEKSFAPERVLTFAVTLPKTRYGTAAAKTQFYQEAITRLAAMPGVQSAAVFTTTPLSNNGVIWTRFRTEKQTEEKKDDLPGGIIQSISPAYFDTLRVPILSGRGFTIADQAGGAEVAIISAHLARRFFPNGDAVGKRLKLEARDRESDWMQVVGVAGDVLYDWTDQTPEFAIYRPFTQSPMPSTLFSIRTELDPRSLTPSLRSNLAKLAPDLPVYDVQTLTQAIDEGVSSLRATGDFISALGILALLLAGIGVYGVMARSVAERRHEIGIRMALGAASSNVLGMVLRRGMLLTLVGIAAGLPLAIALARALASVSYGVQTTGIGIFAGGAVLLAAVSLLACAVPARRAAQVAPMDALRSE